VEEEEEEEEEERRSVVGSQVTQTRERMMTGEGEGREQVIHKEFSIMRANRRDYSAKRTRVNPRINPILIANYVARNRDAAARLSTRETDA